MDERRSAGIFWGEGGTKESTPLVPWDGGTSSTKYSTQFKTTVSIYDVPGNTGNASLCHVHRQPSERETLVQWTLSTTRLPGGLLKWQKAVGSKEESIGVPLLTICQLLYILYLSLHSWHFLRTYHVTNPFNFYNNSIIILIPWMRKMRLWKVKYLSQYCKLVKEVWTQRVEFCPWHSLRLNLYPCWGAGPSTQHQTKANGWALRAGEWGCPYCYHGREKHAVRCLILNCRIPRHDTRNVPLEVWELWAHWCSQENWQNKCCPPSL